MLEVKVNVDGNLEFLQEPFHFLTLRCTDYLPSQFLQLTLDKLLKDLVFIRYDKVDER